MHGLAGPRVVTVHQQGAAKTIVRTCEFVASFALWFAMGLVRASSHKGGLRWDDSFAPCARPRCCFALSGFGSLRSLLGVKGSNPLLSFSIPVLVARVRRMLCSSRDLYTENAMWWEVCD